jgi:TatD DNase family protein
VLKEEKAGSLGVVLHSFTGDTEYLTSAIKENYYISFTGVITFKNTNYINLIDKVPLEQLLLETDSPFLTPVPFRGKRNEPSYIKYIAERISKIKGISVEELANITSENARNLFAF